jgi:hypothetical protein
MARKATGTLKTEKNLCSYHNPSFLLLLHMLLISVILSNYQFLSHTVSESVPDFSTLLSTCAQQKGCRNGASSCNGYLGL